VSVRTSVIQGNPDADLISTSFIERQDLTFRMYVRRLTRLTNAFSKKWANFKAAVGVRFGYHNFDRVHGTVQATPAVAAGVVGRRWTTADLFRGALDAV
jgi:hypothetical protein